MTQVEIQITREQIEGVVAPARAWHGLYRFLAIVSFVLVYGAVITLIIGASGGGQWGLTIPAELKANFPDTSDATFVAAGLAICALILTLVGVYPAAALRNRALRDIPRRFHEMVMNLARDAVLRKQFEEERKRLVRSGIPEPRANAMMATAIDRGRPIMDGEDHCGTGLLFYVIAFVVLLPIMLIMSLVSGNRRS